MTEEKKTTKQYTTKMKQDIFIAGFEKSMCNISAGCKQVPITRKTFYSWMKKNPAFKNRVMEAYEKRKDFGESKLMERINEGNVASLLFFLRTQAKDRGYVERSELDVEGRLEHGHDLLLDAYKKRSKEVSEFMKESEEQDSNDE